MDTDIKLAMLKESPLELQFYAQCVECLGVPLPEWHNILFDVETDFSWFLSAGFSPLFLGVFRFSSQERYPVSLTLFLKPCRDIRQPERRF